MRKIIRVFKAYDFRDVVLSLFAIVLFLLMIVKMMVFPYGFFNFGVPNVYTEGLVSKAGFQNINPLFVDYNDADREVSRLVFSGLMKYDSENRFIVNDMATLTINSDKTQYELKLKDGIKWHDGKPLTIDDVYFTYHDIIMSPEFPNAILKTNFAGVEVSKSGKDTIVFTLEKPNSFFTTNLIIGILPKHILKNVSPGDLLQDEFNKMPIGTGPYMVTEPVEAFPDGRMQVTLSAFDGYYGGKSSIEFMRFIVFSRMDDLIKDINSVNGIPKVIGSYVSTFRSNSRFELFPYELPQYTAVFLNMESEFLKDAPKVRLALQKAVDKKALIDTLVDKKMVDTPLMELKQADWEYKANVDEANGALKDSGFTYPESDTEKSGVRYDEDDKPLELNLIAILYDKGTPQYDEVMKVVSFLKGSWEEIGISIKVDFLSSDVFKKRVMERSYDMVLIGQSLGYNLDTYSYWHSTQANPLGQNLSNYKSFAVDSLISEVRSVFDPQKREEQLKQLAERIESDVPAIFLYRPVYYYVSDGKVSGISMEGVVFPSDRFTNIVDWRFK